VVCNGVKEQPPGRQRPNLIKGNPTLQGVAERQTNGRETLSPSRWLSPPTNGRTAMADDKTSSKPVAAVRAP